MVFFHEFNQYYGYFIELFPKYTIHCLMFIFQISGTRECKSKAHFNAKFTNLWRN